jgi:hypothetical protein
VRLAAAVPPVLGLCASAVVFALGSGLGSEPDRPDPGDDYSVPPELAGYSYLTGSVSSSPPGPAVALFQHGYGVEFMDFPQAVVLGAGGDTYRRVDVAEGRAGGETQGDPAPMLLSPDGRYVAVGDHDTDDPDVEVVDLTTGETTTYPLPQGRSVISTAWSNDGQSLAILLSSAPTNPYSGARIKGSVGILDLSSGTTDVMRERGVTAVAFSPDGSALAVERSAENGAEIAILDSAGKRLLEADGLIAGPYAWSPDGRLLAITTVDPSGAPPEVGDPGIPSGLSFVDVTGDGGDVPEPLELPLAGAGRVLGWSGPDEVVTLLDAGEGDPCCGSDTHTLSTVPLDGSQPRTLMRMSGLQSYGIGRFQLAGAAADHLQVVTPDSIDRGPWPMARRIILALLAGVAVWLVASICSRIVLRFRGRPSRSA